MYKKVQGEQAAFCEEAYNHWLKDAKERSQHVSDDQIRILQSFWLVSRITNFDYLIY